MSLRARSLSWDRLERLHLPEEHALLHAWLGHRLSAPLPGVEALLGAAPHLSVLRLTARPGPETSPGSGDLLLRLQVSSGGQVVARLGGALVRSLLALLEAGPMAPAAPATPASPASPASQATPDAPDAPLVSGALLSLGALAAPMPVSPAEAGILAAVVAAAITDLAPDSLALDDLWAPSLPDHGIPAAHAEDLSPPSALLIETCWTLPGAPGGWLHASLDAEAAESLRHKAGEEPPPLAAARASGLSLAFDFIAAEACCPASEAVALVAGDVIAFPHAPPAHLGCLPGYLSIEGWRTPARLERTGKGRCLTLTGQEVSMPQSDHEPSPFAPSGRLDRLPVRISVSLGKVTLSAADVLRLAPGAVIELREPLGGPVEVLAGGQPFARGELVEVDGALGVRISALLP